MRLVESRLVPVEGDHNCTLKRFVGEAPLTAGHESVVNVHVENGIE